MMTFIKHNNLSGVFLMQTFTYEMKMKNGKYNYVLIRTCTFMIIAFNVFIGFIF